MCGYVYVVRGASVDSQIRSLRINRELELTVLFSSGLLSAGIFIEFLKFCVALWFVWLQDIYS